MPVPLHSDMKNKSTNVDVESTREPTEDEIRDYAFHLYQQSGCKPGHDLDNWLEAKACLEANIPKHHAHRRLHHHRHSAAEDTVTVVTLEAQAGSPLDPLLMPNDEELVERVVVLGTPKN